MGDSYDVKEKANAFLIVMWLIRAIAKYWQGERAFSLQGYSQHARKPHCFMGVMMMVPCHVLGSTGTQAGVLR